MATIDQFAKGTTDEFAATVGPVQIFIDYRPSGRKTEEAKNDSSEKDAGG